MKKTERDKHGDREENTDRSNERGKNRIGIRLEEI
jgi:hypothetical protein